MKKVFSILFVAALATSGAFASAVSAAPTETSQHPAVMNITPDAQPSWSFGGSGLPLPSGGAFTFTTSKFSLVDSRTVTATVVQYPYDGSNNKVSIYYVLVDGAGNEKSARKLVDGLYKSSSTSVNFGTMAPGTYYVKAINAGVYDASGNGYVFF